MLMNGDQQPQTPAPGGTYRPDQSHPVPDAVLSSQPGHAQPAAVQTTGVSDVQVDLRAPQAAPVPAPAALAPQQAAPQSQPAAVQQQVSPAPVPSPVLSEPASLATVAASTPAPQAPAMQPQPDAAQAPFTPVQPDEIDPMPADDGGFFRADPADPSPQPVFEAAPTVEWSTADMDTPHRASKWYALFVVAVLVIAGIVFFLTKELLSPIVVVFVCLLFGFYTARKPHAVHYALNGHGIAIGKHFYSFSQFRSFALIDDGLVLMPLQRFMPILSVHFSHEQADQVIGVLSNVLPMEEHRADAMDKIARTMRF